MDNSSFYTMYLVELIVRFRSIITRDASREDKCDEREDMGQLLHRSVGIFSINSVASHNTEKTLGRSR